MIPRLDFNAVQLDQLSITTPNEKSFYHVKDNETTLEYLRRILGTSLGENEPVLPFFDKMVAAEPDSPFFTGVMRNVPQLDIRDGYDAGLVSRRLCGKIFDTLSTKKIIFLLKEYERRGLRPRAEEVVYLEEKIPQLAESDTIIKELQELQSHPEFELEYILVTLEKPEHATEDRLHRLRVLNVPAPELLVYACSGSCGFLQKQDEATRSKVLALEEKNALYQRLQGIPKSAQLEHCLSRLVSCDTLLDYEFERVSASNFEVLCRLDAQIRQKWINGPGKSTPKGRQWLRAKMVLVYWNKLIEGRPPDSFVFNQYTAQPIVDETERQKIVAAILDMLSKCESYPLSQAHLDNMCKAVCHSRFTYNDTTCYLFRNNVVVQKGMAASAISSNALTDPLVKLLDDKCLSSLVPGNAFERVSREHAFETRPDSYWSEWNVGDFWENEHSEFVCDAAEEYLREIHPLIAKTTHVLLQDVASPCPVILEVCSGAARLAKMISERVEKDLLYIALERNALAIQHGKSLLKDTEKVRLVASDVVAEDVYFEDPEKKIPLADNSVDICIGSGALTKCVMQSKDEASRVLQKIKRYLKQGGYLLLAGFAKHWLNSEDFIASGFSVHNSFVPGNRSFYIVQKR